MMERDRYYPLSDYQLGIFMDHQADSNSTAYNLPYLFTLPEGCDLDRLTRAIEQVFQAHSALLTRITKHDGVLTQYVAKNDSVCLIRQAFAESQLEAYLTSFVRPFEIFDRPLYRIGILETDQNKYLIFDFFHLIFDGGSVVRFLAELDAAYNQTLLQPEQTSALDHALEQTQERGGADWLADETYFDTLLNGVEATDFGGDHPTDGDSKGLRQRVDIEIPKSATGDIRAMGLTPNQVFQAATSVVLSRVCRTERVTHVTLHHGRTDETRKHNLGYYVKTLPVVIDVKKELLVREFLASVRQTQQELYQHIKYPFAEINRKHALTANFYYSYQGLVNEQYTLGGQRLTMRYLPIDQHGISVMVYDQELQYDVRIVYDSAIYSEALATALGQSVKHCVLDMIANPDKKVSQVQLVSDTSALVQLSRGETVPYDATMTFVDLFREQVKRQPHNIAVVDASSSLSYEELDWRADSLAARLREAGIRDGRFVGVMMPREKEYLTAVLGVWKAGGAYLPLDSEYPTDRLQYMMEDSQATVIITTRSMNCNLTAPTVIYLDEHPYQPSEPIHCAQPEHLAYMIYTSGSTGKPKGVIIPHSALTAFVHAMNHLYGLTAADKICCHSSFSFDASVEDLYPVLTVGGQLHILSPALRFDMRALNDYITNQGITGGCYTTQFGEEFLKQFNPKVRYLTVGGEKMDQAPHCDTVVYNTYGPTEFTVDATIFQVENGKAYRNIPIGRPLPNTWAYVLDSYGNLLPREFAGELCMAGKQTARGYWCREELTAEKFIPDPLQPGQMLYRTGDLVRWNDQRMIEYLGRIDQQIKLRGFRIELGEIESRLSSYPDILSCCVEVRKIGTVEHLCAYYKASTDIDIEALKAYLSGSLTEYMVPTVYMALDQIPLTPNGKINRKALPEPVIERNTQYVAPQTETERAVCAIFEEELKLEQVSVNDNFFDIGGSSLLAISALIRLENKGYTLTYGDLFRLKTPLDIAKLIDGCCTDQDKTSDYPIDDYDYSAINELLATQRTDWFGDFTTTDLGNVLLTGATGYLGAHLLWDLVTNTTAKVYCLLRAKKDISIDIRLKTMSMYYFGQTFEELLGTRIFPIEGDITDTNLIDKVKVKIDTVINSAALVKHYEAGQEMEKINYLAVGNLADYCLATGARLVHVSTYSTAGVSVNNSVPASRLFSEKDLYIGQSHVLKYTWTKFLAERLLLEKVATQGLRAKIMRVGNLMGRASDGEFQANFHANAFVNSLLAYKVLRAFPLSRMVEKSEESPIDTVARTIVLLSGTPDDVIVLHPYNCYEHDMGAIINEMQQYGYAIDVVSDDVFAAKFKATMNDADKSARLSGILHGSSSKSIHYIGADNNITTTILYRLGFHWPKTDSGYIKKLLGTLDGMGLFDEI